MASSLAEAPEPKPDLYRTAVPQGLRSKLDFKRGQHLPRFGGASSNGNGRGYPVNLQAASIGTHRIATPVSHGALAHTQLSTTSGGSRGCTNPVPFGASLNGTNSPPMTASNSTASSLKPAQMTAAGPANTECNLRESMGL
jgi:hypothetical protein